LGDFAREAGAEPRQVDAVRLASSEALTNAVLHAYRAEPGSVYVTAAVVAEELWVLVADDGCGLEPRAGRPGLGLGLGLIAQLSEELAIVPRASGGTEVRMRFNLVRTGSSEGKSSSDWKGQGSESRESGGGPDAFRARPSLA
jgi:anti-sigma regulatory factor (Ser/Thr protein kinase)